LFIITQALTNGLIIVLTIYDMEMAIFCLLLNFNACVYPVEMGNHRMTIDFTDSMPADTETRA